VTTLGSLLQLAQPGFACGADDPDGIFQFRMNNISSSSNLVLDKRKHVPLAAIANIGKYYLEPTDILFNATNSPEAVGKSAIVESLDEPAVFSNHFLRLRVDSQQINSSYLWRWLQMQHAMGVFRSMCRQWVNQATIDRTRFLSMEVPLPPLEEQRRIAAILDRADALRAKRRQVLAHLDSLTPAIFASMFGRNPDILNRWSVRRLEDRLDFLTSGSRGWAKYYGSSGAKFLRIQNVQRDRLHLEDLAHVSPPATAEARRTLVVPGDVLLSITADLGRTAVVPPDIGVAHINQHLCILRSSNINPRFLSAFLSSPSGQLQMASKNRAAVKAGLNFEDVRSLMIPVPPEEQQRAFARRAEKVDSKRALLARGAAGDDRLFATLQARAFRGEL
jgi:type I restriction enzyme S subunit